VLSDLATAQAAAIAGVQGAQTATAATVATHTANTNAHGLSEVRSQIAALVAEVDGIDTTIDSYLHVQSTPSAVWTINHNMGKYPSVTVIDSAGSTLYGDYFYPNENTVTLTFSGGFSGKASLR
jgi:pyruvate/oxaloacetate carboxyltransferase